MDPYRKTCQHPNRQPIADKFGAFGAWSCLDCGLDFQEESQEPVSWWGRFLCRWGIHALRFIGISGLGSPVEQCSRCKERFMLF